MGAWSRGWRGGQEEAGGLLHREFFCATASSWSLLATQLGCTQGGWQGEEERKHNKKRRGEGKKKASKGSFCSCCLCFFRARHSPSLGAGPAHQKGES